MDGADAVELLQIAIEHLRIVGVDAGDALVLIRLGQARQGADAALHEQAIAMAVRISDAALVAEQRREVFLDVVGVGEFLRQPPRVFAASAVVVIAVADPVQRRRVNCVAEHILQ